MAARGSNEDDAGNAGGAPRDFQRGIHGLKALSAAVLDDGTAIA